MMATRVRELAHAREGAAAALADAIQALGLVWTRYHHVTTELGERTGQDLTQKMSLPILLHFVEAGLGVILERKPIVHGRPPGLDELVREQHRNLKE
jgi:hypothetical protein